MSIVGPRPTLAYQVEQYTPEQRRRLDVPPGVTGWAQIRGRNGLTWPERIELDVWYVDHRSLGLDLKILVRTVGVVVRPDEVYNEGARRLGRGLAATHPLRAGRKPFLLRAGRAQLLDDPLVLPRPRRPMCDCWRIDVAMSRRSRPPTPRRAREPAS